LDYLDENSVISIDFDGTGVNDNYASITLVDVNVSLEDLTHANALIVL
jgi:hypothetical protein